MESETDGQVQQPVAAAASTQMREAREAAGLSLADVAGRTRVPLRHLEALERGDYGALPGVTYCAGFARAYARAVGLDEKALVAQVREEVDRTGDFTEQYQVYEPADPARVPPRSLAWAAAIIAILLASGYGLWRMQLNAPPVDGSATVEAPEAQQGAPRPAPVAPPALTGPVVLTAVEDVWLRIYDADGKSILQKTLAKGESYTVPADANNPMILTGRPDALAVTVGGRSVPPLGTAERTISDVPISAQALLARDNPAAQAPATVTGQASAPAAQPAVSQPLGTRPATPASQATRPAQMTRPATPASPTQRRSTTTAPAAGTPSGTTAPASAPAPAAAPPAASGDTPAQ